MKILGYALRARSMANVNRPYGAIACYNAPQGRLTLSNCDAVIPECNASMCSGMARNKRMRPRIADSQADRHVWPQAIVRGSDVKKNAKLLAFVE